MSSKSKRDSPTTCSLSCRSRCVFTKVRPTGGEILLCRPADEFSTKEFAFLPHTWPERREVSFQVWNAFDIWIYNPGYYKREADAGISAGGTSLPFHFNVSSDTDVKYPVRIMYVVFYDKESTCFRIATETDISMFRDPHNMFFFIYLVKFGADILQNVKFHNFFHKILPLNR